MDLIERDFSSKAISRSGISLYHPSDAIEVIRMCRRLRRQILGIDVFWIREQGVQPVQAESIDFSAKGMTSGNWDEAEQFVRERRNDGLVFEVVYE